MQKSNIFRLIKFGIVGGSGVIVNQGVFMLLSLTTLGVATRSPIAIFTAMTSNFLLNNFWTWNDRSTSRKRDFSLRYLKFFISSGATALLFNYLPLLYMVNKLSWNENISNIIGIGVASIANYFISHFWTFRESVHPEGEKISDVFVLEDSDPFKSLHYLQLTSMILKVSLTEIEVVDTLPQHIHPIFDELPQGEVGAIKKGLYEETIALEIKGHGYITFYDMIDTGAGQNIGNAFYSWKSKSFEQWWLHETKALAIKPEDLTPPEA